jgi:hypothetical protein
MSYEPPEIRTGLALSALGGLLVLLLALLALRRSPALPRRDETTTPPALPTE